MSIFHHCSTWQDSTWQDFVLKLVFISGNLYLSFANILLVWERTEVKIILHFGQFFFLFLCRKPWKKSLRMTWQKTSWKHFIPQMLPSHGEESMSGILLQCKWATPAYVVLHNFLTGTQAGSTQYLLCWEQMQNISQLSYSMVRCTRWRFKRMRRFQHLL